MKQLCSVLCYLHTREPQVIHGDIKPGNIMLTPQGDICLIDFNISSATAKNVPLWIEGYTRGYASPEQIEAFRFNQNERNLSNWKSMDARADIYSLGATVYHMLTGQKPEANEAGCIEDIRDNDETINEVFADVIMKCLEADPAKRYQSAAELLSDLQNLAKNDRRYRSLLLRQRIEYGAVAAAAFFFCMVAVFGYIRIGKEKQTEYETLVSKEVQCVTAADYDTCEVYYEKAVKILPDRLDAYYQKAIALNEQRRYGDCIDFLNEKVLSNSEILKNTEEMDGVYSLLGDAYEEMEDYENAASCYEKAITLSPMNSSYYRNYAIILARGGNTEKAEEILEKAKENGMDSVEVNYAEGEIIFASGRYEEARQIFMDCLEQSDDNDLKMRAYLMAASSMEKLDSSAQGKEEIITLLEQAKAVLPKEYNIGVLEKLTQVYSEMGNMEGDSSYYEKAVAVLQQIENQGMEDYDTEYNLSTLYQNLQEYGKAAEVLSGLEENYAENYRTYKGLAFLEVAKQAALEKGSRNYSKFEEYYKKAQELYQAQLENNANDIEMQRLEELYEQAVSNGWLNG